MPTAYYNEIDKFAAQWLRNLMDAGEIAPGTVDERDIWDVAPTDLAGYDRCHFFAGIAGWDYALRLAGWPDEWPVWTGSCPCQPFSAAGKRGGFADERHLWPAWFHLIRVCRPPIIFGEQVASKDGLKWLDLVCSDLEAEGYAIGAADLCAAGIGAPHIRQRLWFMAIANDARCKGDGLQPLHGGGNWGRQELRPPGPSPTGLVAFPDGTVRRAEQRPAEQTGHNGRESFGNNSPTGLMADTGSGRGWGRQRVNPREERRAAVGIGQQDAGELADTRNEGLSQCQCQTGRGKRPRERGAATLQYRETPTPCHGRQDAGKLADAAGQRLCGGSQDGTTQQPTLSGQNSPSQPANNPWSSLLWLPCRDGKFRPTQPGLHPLAYGTSNRVGRLRAYGNAIVPQIAAEFIKAFLAVAVRI